MSRQEAIAWARVVTVETEKNSYPGGRSDGTGNGLNMGGKGEGGIQTYTLLSGLGKCNSKQQSKSCEKYGLWFIQPAFQLQLYP